MRVSNRTEEQTARKCIPRICDVSRLLSKYVIYNLTFSVSMHIQCNQCEVLPSGFQRTSILASTLTHSRLFLGALLSFVHKTIIVSI